VLLVATQQYITELHWACAVGSYTTVHNKQSYIEPVLLVATQQYITKHYAVWNIVYKDQSFSFYLSSQNVTLATELTEELLPANNKSNIKLNTSTFYLISTLYAKHQRLTSKWSITWWFRLTNRLSMASCADQLDCTTGRLLDWSSYDCVLSVTGLLVLSVTTWILIRTCKFRGHALAQCLRHWATNRKVAGSIPDGVIGIFQ
jgi:hypothetical protein